MRYNPMGVFVAGAMMGSAAFIGLAASDRCMRRRMRSKAMHTCRMCMHKAEKMFR